MRYRALGVLVAVLAVAYSSYQLSRDRDYQLFGRLLASVETSRPVVALTFDDGPVPERVSEVIDLLAEQDVRATFFLNGEPAAAHPEAVAALVAAGHELGNHAWHHDRMVLMRPSRVRAEILDTDAVLRAAGYDGPITFRPPYGKKLFVLPWVLSEMERTTVMWDIEPESAVAADAGPREIADYVIQHAEPGSIILLHVMFEHGEASRQALPLIVSGLRDRGFEFVTIREMLDLHEQSS